MEAAEAMEEAKAAEQAVAAKQEEEDDRLSDALNQSLDFSSGDEERDNGVFGQNSPPPPPPPTVTDL